MHSSSIPAVRAHPSDAHPTAAWLFARSSSQKTRILAGCPPRHQATRSGEATKGGLLVVDDWRSVVSPTHGGAGSRQKQHTQRGCATPSSHQQQGPGHARCCLTEGSSPAATVARPEAGTAMHGALRVAWEPCALRRSLRGACSCGGGGHHHPAKRSHGQHCCTHQAHPAPSSPPRRCLAAESSSKQPASSHQPAPASQGGGRPAAER